MRTEADIELEGFIKGQLDGGNRTALRDRSPAFEISTYSLADGSQQTIIYHDGLRQVHPEAEFAALEGITESELPTIIMGGKAVPVYMAKYKRKERKKIIRESAKKLLEELVAISVAGGYENAGGIVRSGEIIIKLNGFCVEEDV